MFDHHYGHFSKRGLTLAACSPTALSDRTLVASVLRPILRFVMPCVKWAGRRSSRQVVLSMKSLMLIPTTTSLETKRLELMYERKQPQFPSHALFPSNSHSPLLWCVCRWVADGGWWMVCGTVWCGVALNGCVGCFVWCGYVVCCVEWLRCVMYSVVLCGAVWCGMVCRPLTWACLVQLVEQGMGSVLPCQGNRPFLKDPPPVVKVWNKVIIIWWWKWL